MPHAKAIADIEECLEPEQLKGMLREYQRVQQEKQNKQQQSKLEEAGKSGAGNGNGNRKEASIENVSIIKKIEPVKIPFVYKRAIADMCKDISQAYNLPDNYEDLEESDLED